MTRSPTSPSDSADSANSADPAKGPRASGRQRLRRTLADLHARLRGGQEPPARQAAALGIGAFIGCSPFYGFHFALCLLAARIFRLDAVKTYLAANISLPVFAPFLAVAEIEVGRLLRGEPALLLHPSQIGQVSLARFGLDLLLGSVVVGGVLGALFAFAGYRSAVRARREPEIEAWIEAAAARYLDAGMFTWEFVRGKLRHDPLYLGLLRRGLLPDQGRLLDLGCGRGILFALLAAARTTNAPAGWPTPPRDLAMHGLEGDAKVAEVARNALHGVATIETADLARTEPSANGGWPSSQAVLLLDVLHYLPAPAQEELLARAAAALSHGEGTLLIRDADAAGGWRFAATRLQERVSALARGHWRQRFHYRTAREWMDLISRTGLEAEAIPLSEGTPYANVLVVGRKTASESSVDQEDRR